MQPSKAALKAALRVLTALSEHQDPDPADVDELHWYAPADRERPIDELACDAIQLALKDRDQTRKAVKATMRRRALAINSGSFEGLMETAVATSRKERDREVARLLLEYSQHKQEYLDVCARLKRAGIVLQHTTENLLAAAAGDLSKSSDSLDVNAIIHLLNEHVRLSRTLLSEQETLRTYGIQQ